MRLPLATLLALALGGCTSTWQRGEPPVATASAAAADAVPRYTGKLRRVVLLPATVRPVDEACAHRVSPDTATWVEEDVRAFLLDWKGYEVIILAPGAAEAERDLARALGEWQQDASPDSTLPAPLTPRLRAFIAAQRADAALTLYAAPQCITTTEAVLGVLIVGAPNLIGKVAGRDFSAGIYDASGSLVWRSSGHLGPVNADTGLPRTVVRDAVERRFELLENAIPEVLLR